jgi:hypothetical protein
MSGSSSTDAGFPLRGEKPSHPFLWIGNEVLDLYVPIIGPDCLAVYAYFARRYHSDHTLRHDIRSIARSCCLNPSTVSRALEVLDHLQLVKLIRFGGSRQSECLLSDVWTIVNRLGATFDPRTQSYCFPEPVFKQLTEEVCEIRVRQQGKADGKTSKSALMPSGNPSKSVSQGNASFSPEKRLHPTRETQAGIHLIQKKERIKEVPSPTSSHDSEDWRNAKNIPNEDGPEKDAPLARAQFNNLIDGLRRPAGKIRSDADLQSARAKFNGVMDDLKDALLLTNRPIVPHLTKSFDDWNEFRFNSLCVVDVERHGNALLLTLETDDVLATQRGLAKYRKRWESSCRNWYGGVVQVKLMKSERKW